jgi:hypothetical protein
VKAGLPIVLADQDAERANRNHRERIDELQALPLVGARVVPGVELADGITTQVAHKLGRAPAWIGVSAVRGASTTGRIDDTSRTGGNDRAKFAVLTATGWGATITVDLLVL